MIGHTVGNYQVRALLGEGGMGTVYRAEHLVMGWPAAIKVLRRSLADDKVLVRRFINEARVIKAAHHPNIVEIIDVGILPDGLPYLLMELLEGETLGARLKRLGRLTVEQALDVTCQTAIALGAAHAKGIIHRDLKPDNLFLTRDPDNPARDKVKVLDFGIAKLHDADGASAHTRQGVLLGTPAYMSPEQCRGIAEAVDHRADIYALAVILYQMLAGKAPFVGPGTGDVLIMHVSSDPPPVSQENPAVPRFVEEVILRGLAKLREQRFQSMGEMVEALQGPAPDTLQIPMTIPAEPLRTTATIATVATPLTWTTSSTKTGRRLSRRAMGIGLVAVLAVPLLLMIAADGIHGVARWTWGQKPTPAAPPPATPGGLTRTPAEERPAVALPAVAPPNTERLPAGVAPARVAPAPPATAAATPDAAPGAPAAITRPKPAAATARKLRRPKPPSTPARARPAEATPARRAEPWL